MSRYKILLEYEGTNYHGWQVQKGETTVQEELEKALSTVLRRHIGVVGSGRTDAGVHARGQVAHFDGDDSADLKRLCHSLNGLLPDDIAVVSVQPAHDAFHARYDATARRYRYFVTTRPAALERRFRSHVHASTDFDLMNRAATALITTTDFSSFCRTQSETKNRVCSVSIARWVSEPAIGFHFFEVEADRFLHGMVRAIVGTLLEIGRGLRATADIETVLSAHDRRAAGPAAPACGLVLEEVTYPGAPRSDTLLDRPE
ncbi:MAG: tRNA pseudouridine(38-40) synthase TruA [Rhodothermales bacterium]|nr:tRNA pseudouridine(38-40) synthase TruA [Rhodothermales bacterium]